LATFTSLFSYEGAGRQVITTFKYRGHRSLALPLGRALATLWQAGDRSRPRTGSAMPVVTWAPTTLIRRRERGFDQAEALARAMATSSRHRLVPLLIRHHGLPQTGHDAARRATGPTFGAAADTVPPVVVVIDDVRTTGATLAAAAEALTDAGCRCVHGLVVASTPLPSADT
jgi:predicted amidophosphoribosyltransferase